MRNRVICKACGYVMNESSLGDRCPACGVGRQAFEPYQSRISARRETLLSLDIHPVMVHFPQAFTYTIPMVLVLGHLMPGWRDPLLGAARVLSIGLPFVVCSGFATGILDGVVRFKKATTKMLVMKMIVGSLFLASSAALALTVWVSGFTRPIAVSVFLAVSMGCAAALGLIGSRLTTSKLPG